MEELIPLLNERHNLEWVLGSSRDNGDYLFVKGDKENKFYEEQIISKKFGFIKRLVENDKIDRDKSKIITAKTEIVLGTTFTDGFVVTKRYWLYEQLLMLLAISDTPIDDLVLYLK